jgi:prolyl 4-hydroxylase
MSGLPAWCAYFYPIKYIYTVMFFSILCLTTLIIMLAILSYYFYDLILTTPDIEVTRVEGRKTIKRKYGSFEIWEVYNIFTPAECEKIIGLAEKKGFDLATIGGINTQFVDYKVRTSKVSWLKDDVDEVITNFAKLTEKISRLPDYHQEIMQVAKYDVGGEFKRHYDQCDENIPRCKRGNRITGGRKSTLLVYLNDDYEGGETEFPLIYLTIKPERGKGIFFINVDKNHKIEHYSLHGGLPVTKNTKYICTKWTHVRPQLQV